MKTSIWLGLCLLFFSNCRQEIEEPNYTAKDAFEFSFVAERSSFARPLNEADQRRMTEVEKVDLYPEYEKKRYVYRRTSSGPFEVITEKLPQEWDALFPSGYQEVPGMPKPWKTHAINGKTSNYAKDGTLLSVVEGYPDGMGEMFYEIVNNLKNGEKLLSFNPDDYPELKKVEGTRSDVSYYEILDEPGFGRFVVVLDDDTGRLLEFLIYVNNDNLKFRRAYFTKLEDGLEKLDKFYDAEYYVSSSTSTPIERLTVTKFTEMIIQ